MGSIRRPASSLHVLRRGIPPVSGPHIPTLIRSLGLWGAFSVEGRVVGGSESGGGGGC